MRLFRKKNLALLGLYVLFSTLCLCADVLHKTAVLILPEQVECKLGSGYFLSGEMGIRWDESDPLTISVWRDPKSAIETDEPNYLPCDLEVFDEAGKKLERRFFVSIPPMPEGVQVIKRGEYRRLGFFIWNGSVVFPRPGNYYAIATFRDAWTGTTNVVFTTTRRWFKVAEAPPKKSHL
jgi:hypothetical protein